MPGDREILGAIESARNQRNHLVICGWIETSSPISGFRVSAGHAKLANVSWKCNFHNGATTRRSRSKRRFEIRAPIPNAAGRQVRDCLICVTPLLGGHAAESLFTVLKPSLPLPPKRDWPLFIWNFLPEGCLILRLLVNDARIGRDESVLDIGCGLGRMAYVLSYFLSPRGRYEGIEPTRRWVHWNKSVFGSRFPNFRFKHLAVHNPLYNPKGKLDAATARFPYADSTFDLAFATAVFQHNRAAVAQHYLGEIGRVLRPGGRCLITCFLLDAKPLRQARKKETLSFPYSLTDCWANNDTLPETGIAFLERDFRQWAARHKLAMRKKLRGSWHGSRAKLYQDMVILKKPGA